MSVNAILIGAGLRGMEAYAPYALNYPDKLKFVAVAEPDKIRREKFQKLHNLTDEQCFESWEPMLAKAKFADACLVCNQDADHFEPTMIALEKGYSVLLEKPMSKTKSECQSMIAQADKHGVSLTVCHVLRYTPFYNKIKELLNSGVIGDIVTVEHSENVGFWHQAHSFVRGNWRKAAETNPMIMAKACHDMDIITWLIDKDCLSVSSFGSLKYFNAQNAPEGAPNYCLDGCKHADTCAFYAPRLYTDESRWQTRAIRKAVTMDPSNESLMEALKSGQYGRCVFHCDNDVVDHQVVSMQFENGITASFTMAAFTFEESRMTRILGTKGEIFGNMAHNHIEYRTFLDGVLHEIDFEQSDVGHGGGDEGIMRDFVEAVNAKKDTKSSAKQSLQSHLMSFAAEESRISGNAVSIASI